jgi:hypothetical protein
MTGSGKIQKFKLKELGVELCKKQGIGLYTCKWGYRKNEPHFLSIQ